MTKKYLLILILTVFTTASSQAGTLLVPSEYSTIQLAIHRSNDGDVIIVSPGTYLENINFLGKNVILTSTDPQDPEIVASTIINGYGSGSAISLINGESREAVITGFTISGGYGTVNPEIGQEIYWGAGVYCFNSSPTIMGNIVANNNGPMKIEGNQLVAASYGVGISCLLGGPLITNNIIRNNKGYAGAGIMTYVSDAVISNNLIYDNSAYIGGGIVMLGSGLLINNTIIANDSSNRIEGQEGLAGNIYAVSDPDIGYFTMKNNIICNAKSGGGVLATDINNNTIEYNNVWNNTMGDYLSIDDQTGQISQGRAVNQTGKNGNISIDPLCVDTESYDYHLQMNSPCINAGDPNFIVEPDQTDIDGDPRVYAARVDIGADEYVGYIKPIANAGPDQYAGPNQLVTLDGSGSFIYDPNGILTFEWTQISGPRVVLSNPTSMNPTFTPQIQSQYIFELVVSDSLSSSSPDQVTIFVENRSPVADAGPDQSFSSVPDMVILDGSGSYDPEDDELTYVWRQTDGPNIELNDADTVSPSFTPVPTVLTVYIFELIVKDEASNISQPDFVAVVTGNHAPIADASSSRYTASDPIVLDGTGSFDIDGYGELTYEWQQISGPAVNITGENTATPTISGFVQTNRVQRCGFQLIISDGELESNPDTVEVIIVPDFGNIDFVQVNPPFDPNKPTIVGFGGGDCNIGVGIYFTEPTDWFDNANYLTVDSYGPPYNLYGDALIVLLSNAAPDYTQPIQTVGFSTGNMPAIDVAVQINKTYADERFAVNRVSLLDAACREYADNIYEFNKYKLAMEEFWIENYYSTNAHYYPGTINIRFPAPPAEHSTPASWYQLSPEGNIYNDGVTAGYYISVAGPGKNLRLGTDVENFYFEWNSQTDYLNFYDQAAYPCKIPEAVALIGPPDGGAASLGRSGTVLSCQYSDSAVSYQLLFGPSPDCMNYLVSETPNPPDQGIITFPFETTHWTVRVTDDNGSSIYTNPIRITSQKVAIPIIENISTSRQYNSIQKAIDAARDGDEIVVHPGIYQHFENINFKGKAITVRSTDPDDSDVVAATVLNNGLGAAATFSNLEDVNSILCGFTITGTDMGIKCIGSSPKIDKCTFTNNIGPAITLLESANPTITNCIIAANASAGIDMSALRTGRGEIYNLAEIINCTIVDNLKEGVLGGKPTIRNSIVYFNGSETDNVQINSDFAVVTYSDIQGSWPGVGNIDTDPLFADLANGDYHLKSQTGRWNPVNESWVQDDVTSLCIDAGDPLSNIGLEPEPNGSVINMGAYGGTVQASKSP